MTEDLPYSDEEWALLTTVPQTVVSALMLAHTGGMTRETLAMMEAIAVARHQFAESRLVQAVLDGVERGEGTLGDGQTTRPDQAPNMAHDALVQSRRASLLLHTAPQAEAEAYRQFVHFIAQRVADAHKEGGFLGIGGKHVSPEEVAIIRDVDQALLGCS